MPFLRKVMLFYDFANIKLRFFQLITAICHCCINMYHISRKKNNTRTKKNFIGYLFCLYWEAQYSGTRSCAIKHN